VLDGTWIVVFPARGLDPEVRAIVMRALSAHGAAAVVLELRDEDLTRKALAGLVTEKLAAVPSPRGVVSLLSASEEVSPGLPGVPAGLAGTLLLVQALGDAAVSAPLWCLTRDGGGPGSRETSPSQAAAWGLGRVIALEHPARWGGLIDLPAVMDDQAAALIATALTGTGAEDQLAVRSSGLLGRRLVRLPAGRETERPWRPHGTVLITGGTGAVGGHTARWLAGQGAEHLMLVSRRGPEAPGATSLRAELESLGAHVTISACDVADRQALCALLETVPADLPLTAVVHAAGVLDDGLADELTPERLAGVLAVKAQAAQHLHELTLGHDLSEFILFSSLAGAVGNAGQGSYAAANAFLDALAERRRAEGMPATAVAWGPWAEGGMAAGDMTDRASRAGLSPMAPEHALTALRHVLEHDESGIIVASVAWDRFASVFAAGRPSPLLELVAPAQASVAPAAEPSQAERLKTMPARERESVLTDLVRTHAAATLGHPDTRAVRADRTFKELGFDSLSAVGLRNSLEPVLGSRLPPTLVFDHPTPAALGAYLASQLGGAEPAQERILASLRDLESALTAAGADDADHGLVSGRLKLLLATWDDRRQRSGRPNVNNRLEEASADEVIDFIHSQLGLS
jgi:short-subunit dehydrogenase/acyl carrier protein